MRCEQLSSLEISKVFYNGENSKIYKLTDGRLMKIPNQDLIDSLKRLNADYERKLLDTRARSISEIVNPYSIVLNARKCVGYTTEDITGVTLTQKDKGYTLKQRRDLYHYAFLYEKIEDVVKRANKEGIVMPDLCTCDNIIVQPDGSLKFVDYDGMQMGSTDKAMALSTLLGNPFKYILSSKYSTSPFSFTTELDKTSLTFLMFIYVFNVNLSKLGIENPFTHKKIDLNDVFESIGIQDEEFKNKVRANLSDNKKGCYLSDELFKIAERYTMDVKEIDKSYIKKLSLK